MAKIGFVSLGCPKNLVDSEVMLGLLQGQGHQITSSEREAEIIVVNTCAFIESSKQESVDTILEMAQQKERGNCRRLIVAGCLVERYRHEIQRLIPEVDAVIGTNEIPDILKACEASSTSPPTYESRELYLYSDTEPRMRTTPRYTAYIKIAEGCDHPCSFCVIPQMRGRFRSRPLDSILTEAHRMASEGVREINLVAQDSTMYGRDLGQKGGLAELIEKLGEIEELAWVRSLYIYPNSVTDEFLKSIAASPNACRYIDIPLQHASRQVLRRMKRGGNRLSLHRLMDRIRRYIPDCTLRTTMIVGFPEETDADFEELVAFVREAQFDRLGVFPYSDEEDAASHGLDRKVPDDLMKERRTRLMKIQSGISRRKNELLIGQTFPVLLEGISRESEHLWEGRLATQAPEIDGTVYLNDGVTEDVFPGQIRPVRITEAHDYDLVGAVV